MFVLLYITRPRGITSTIAIAIGPRHIYNVIYEGAKKNGREGHARMDHAGRDHGKVVHGRGLGRGHVWGS